MDWVNDKIQGYKDYKTEVQNSSDLWLQRYNLEKGVTEEN